MDCSRVNFNFTFLPCYEEYGTVEARLHAFSRGKRKKFHASLPPHIPIYMSSPLPPHSLTIPSSPSRSVHTDVGSCHQLITYTSERRFGLIDVAHKGQEGHTTACTE
jgi:hypothetical protein